MDKSSENCLSIRSADESRVVKLKWNEYVGKIKAYALTCVDNQDDFMDWMDYVKPLANWDGRIAK